MSSALFILSWSPAATGGVNQAVIGLSRALLTVRGPRPLIGVASWEPIALPEEVHGIPILGVQLHDGYGAGNLATLKSLLRLPSDLWAIHRVVKRHDVSVINVHFPTLGSLVLAVLRIVGLYRGKLALTFHGADIRSIAGLGRVSRFAWRLLIKSVDVVFTCSSALATEVAAVCPGRVVTVIPNGADIGAFGRAARSRVSTGRFELLNIGKFEHKKGQDVLLSAMHLLLERGRDVRLTLVGAKGPDFDSVRASARALGDRVRVVTDAPHSTIPALMAEADAFVLPSRAEGFPIVLIEAGAAGLPIIATEIPGVIEFLTDRRDSLLVPVDNATALADAIDLLLKDERLRVSLADNIKSHASDYTWDRHAERFQRALGL